MMKKYLGYLLVASPLVVVLIVLVSLGIWIAAATIIGAILFIGLSVLAVIKGIDMIIDND